MKKSTIFLAVVALIIYGLVLVVSPDISTIIAAVAGIVVAIVFFGILVARTKSPFIQRISWLNTVPLFIIFLAVPITFAVLLFIQGKLSIILILVMVSLAFSFFYGFLNIPLAVYHKYEEKKYTKGHLAAIHQLVLLFQLTMRKNALPEL